MNLLHQNIKEIVEQVISSKNFFSIDLIIRGENKNHVIEVYVDSEKNVSADDCAEISREINKEFEEKNIFESGYRLEVSSPGVNRPLKLLQQFPKHINRKFDVSYRESDIVKKITGTLKSIESNNLVFMKNNREEIQIDFENIIKAKIIISFS
jgi:ribosome maturation factor RimP